MFNKIKFLLYKTKIIKPKTFLDKIDYLLSVDVSMTEIVSIEERLYYTESIIKEISFIESVLTEDFTLTYVKALLDLKPRTINKNLWFSNEGRIIEDSVTITKKWLILIRRIYMIYRLGISNPSSGYYYINSNKLKPYIINIEDTVVELFTHKYR